MTKSWNQEDWRQATEKHFEHGIDEVFWFLEDGG